MEVILVNPDLEVRRVGADGTIEVEPARPVAPHILRRMSVQYAEGHYILLTGGGTDAVRPPEVFHVEVIDVREHARMTLRTGSDALGRIKADMPAALVRPLNATTARLRALPARIPFSDPQAPSAKPEEAARLKLYGRSVYNLKNIGLAIHNYHSANGYFPPAIVFGPDGKPWHSWRVLVLPFLEQGQLYNAYDFREPWDSPKNRALINKMPEVYADPVAGAANDSFTHYAALVGPDAIFKPEGIKLRPSDLEKPLTPAELGRGTSIREVTDGTSNTATVTSVEPGHKIPWTKPEDIDAGPSFAGIGKPGGIATPFTYDGAQPGSAAPLLFADGSVKAIDSTIQPELLKALITRNGGELFPLNAIPTRPIAMTGPAAGLRVLRIRGAGGQARASVE